MRQQRLLAIGLIGTASALSACSLRAAALPSVDVVLTSPLPSSESSASPAPRSPQGEVRPAPRSLQGEVRPAPRSLQGEVRPAPRSLQGEVGSLRIAVPFSPQAPDAVWDPLHEEACEEMSLIMVGRYWNHRPLSRSDAETELQGLIRWEAAHGYPEDVTSEQLVQIAKEQYGLQADVSEDVSAERIRAELRNGRPVIVPAAGRLLGNPYFSGEGPWYHMLVITGFAPGRFITNDPGTRRGEGYVYDEAVLLHAIHDWTGKKEDILQGPKRMIIVRGTMNE